jgi:hypothetical protein
LETTLALTSGVFRGTARAFKNQGIPGLESQLNDAWFQWVGRMKLHPRLALFFAGLVDFRNIMRLYKSMRWELAEPPRFIPGGRVSRVVLAEIFTRGDRAAISELLDRLEAEPAEGDASPESGMLEMIGRRLQRGSRGTDSYGPIIEYLWRIYVETRNMAVLLAAASVNERQSLLRELPG